MRVGIWLECVVTTEGHSLLVWWTQQTKYRFIRCQKEECQNHDCVESPSSHHTGNVLMRSDTCHRMDFSELLWNHLGGGGTKPHSYLDMWKRLQLEYVCQVLQSRGVFMNGNASYSKLPTTCNPGEQEDQMWLTENKPFCCHKSHCYYPSNYFIL